MNILIIYFYYFYFYFVQRRASINLLNPTCHVMHQQFNLLKPSGFFTFHQV